VSRQRTIVLVLIAATLVVGTLGYLVATGGGEDGLSPVDPLARHGAAPAASATTSTATGAPSIADSSSTTAVDPALAAAPTTTAVDSTSTTGFKKRADGTYEPTGAGQSAYPTYPGGDFDDTSPNNVTSAGTDENGCDNNYSGACVPPLPAHVTCADLGVVNFEVVIGDPQGLDPDNDGLACDSEDIIRTDEGERSSDPAD